MGHPTSNRTLAIVLLASALGLAPAIAEARGGVRGGASTSISRPSGGGAHAANRGGGARANTGAMNSGNRSINNSGNRTNVNTGNRNVNINSNNNVNINVDNGRDWDDHYHPIARGVAVGTAIGVTAAVVGSMIYTLPPACAPYPYRGYSYYSCGGVYYETRYEGDKVVYVVVDQPG